MTTHRTTDTTTTRRGGLTGLGKLLTALGALLLIGGLLWALVTGLGGKAAENLQGPVPGTVTKVDNGIPTVRYSAGGQNYEKATAAAQSPQPKVGDQVQVRYAQSAPDKPIIGDSQQISNAKNNWWWGLIPAILGLGLLLAGLSLREKHGVGVAEDHRDGRRVTESRTVRVEDDSPRRTTTRVEDRTGRSTTDRNRDGVRDDRDGDPRT